MKSSIAGLNKIFDSRIRIGVMSALTVNAELSFNALKEVLDATDGNLATHLRTLEEAGYVQVRKGFLGRKTNTTYTLTKSGDKAFRAHLNALEAIIKSIG